MSSSIQSCLKTWGFDGNCLLISLEDDLQLFFAHSIIYDGVKLGVHHYEKLLPECVDAAFLNVFDSEAASNGNFNGLSSLGGNWLSACDGDALMDLDVSTDLSVEGCSVTICSPVDSKGTFAASGGWSFSTLSFPKTYSTMRLSKMLHRKIHNVNDTP